MSNPFLDKIEHIAEAVMKREAPSIIEKAVSDKVENLLSELVPLEVAKQLHKLLAGDEMSSGKGKKKSVAKFDCSRRPHRGRCGQKCREAAGISEPDADAAND